jgi:hypothetical protein
MPLKWRERLADTTLRLETSLKGKTWDAVSKQLVELFIAVLSRMASGAKPPGWKTMKLTWWTLPDRIVVDPQRRGKAPSDPLLSAVAEIPLFGVEFRRFPSKEKDPDLFESYEGALWAKVGLAHLEALGNKAVKQLIKKVANKKRFMVSFQVGEDTESAHRWVF